MSSLNPSSLTEWTEQHQPFELKYHQVQGVKWCANPKLFDPFWQGIKEFIGEPRGSTLDIGCGPRPPFAPCYVIEPLALSYQMFAPKEWWTGVHVIPTPAEVRMDGLREEFDTVVCWNCLDHTYDWKAILDNVCYYMKPHARFALATDFNPPHLGHPGFARDDFEHEIVKRFDVLFRLNSFRERHLALLMMKK